MIIIANAPGSHIKPLFLIYSVPSLDAFVYNKADQYGLSDSKMRKEWLVNGWKMDLKALKLS